MLLFKNKTYEFSYLNNALYKLVLAMGKKWVNDQFD